MPHHPAYVLHPSDLIRTTPSQDLKDDISTYFYRYIDFMQLRGYLENNSKTLDDPYEMDKFISGATYSKEILHLTRDDRRSTDPAILTQYSQSRIVGQLSIIYPKVPTPKSTGTAVTPSERASLQTPTKLYSKSPRRTKRSINALNTLEYNFAMDDPYISIPDPVTTEEFKVYKMYSRAILAIETDPRRFDQSKSPCAVCQKSGHTFDNCQVLQDFKFLQKFHIAYCLHRNKINKIKHPSMMTASTNKVLATTVESDSESDESESEADEDSE